MNNYKDFLDKLTKELEQSKKVLIVSHLNPDDDSISSVLSMYHFVKEIRAKEQVEIVYGGSFGKRWSSFKYFEEIKCVEDVFSYADSFDLVIFLDGNQYSRFSNNPPIQLSKNYISVCIDHHSSPPSDFDLLFIDHSHPANAIVVYKLLYEGKEYFNSVAANLLLLGILGDTGNFRFINYKQAETLSIAKDIIQVGEIDIQNYKSRYEGYSMDAYRFIQNPIQNISIIEGVEGLYPPFIATYIDFDILDQLNNSDLLINELAHIFMDTNLSRVRGYGWGFIMYPKSNGDIKISARSLPNNVNVRVLCQDIAAYYGKDGGGHNLSAGCSLPSEIESSTKTMKDYFHDILELLNKKKVIVNTEF